MSIFAFYFATQLLRQAGWPRKLGMFKGVGYDAVMVDAAFAQSIEWGAALGAGRPQLALPMIAAMFPDRHWEGDHAANVKGVVQGRREDEPRWGPWGTAASPQEAVPSRIQFATGMAALSHEQFLGLKGPTTEQFMLDALLWGLDNPNRFEAWYSAKMADYASKLPVYRKAGLEVDDELRPLPQFYEDSEQIVRDYERDIQPLPSIPARLLADAQALGWRVRESPDGNPSTRQERSRE